MMDEIIEFFDPAEFSLEMVDNADGTVSLVTTITGRTRKLLERRAIEAGMSYVDYVEEAILSILPRDR